jgi:transcriptional regulator with XRE-family HTH domain
MSLSKKKAAQVKKDLAEKKLTRKEIAKKHGLNVGTLSHIVRGVIHKDVPWPAVMPTTAQEDRIRELEAEVACLNDEKKAATKTSKALIKADGLFRAIVKEMETRIIPFEALPSERLPRAKTGTIQEHAVLHLSDMHADQVITPEECNGLEEFNFPIACARAERLVDKAIKWCMGTLAPQFQFPVLTVLAYGDFTSGEIHGHAQRSYYRNSFKNCFAIGQLQALMYRDLAAHFPQVNILHLSGNHGRRTEKKDYHGAHDNFDYLVGEVARLYCRDLPNVSFTIPNSWSANVVVNGVGIHVFHGDEVPGTGGAVPWYGITRKQDGLTAINSMGGGINTQIYACGHFHRSATLADKKGELLINGAWPATDAYSFNRFSGYREPSQWLHGVDPKYGITWRINLKMKHPDELMGPKRYIIDGGREVGPL